MSMDEEKRERIINAAMKEFMNGYKAASTDIITRDAGISKGLLFHYFGTKERLFVFLLSYASDMMQAKYFDLIDLTNADIIDNLWHLSQLKQNLMKQYPTIFEFLISAHTSETNDTAKMYMEQFSTTQAQIMEGVFYNHNPIHHLECRLKGVKSIFEKLQKRGLNLDLDSMQSHVHDIAGIRVICNFVDDIYLIEKFLLQQYDIKLVEREDYIECPKENGYRSLHLIVEIPVFLSNEIKNIPVEIQFRTIAMDYWASLEHMLRYKNNQDDINRHSATLLECANTLAETEKTMQNIRMSIEGENEKI